MTVVRPSKLQRDGLFAVLIAAFAVALVRGLYGAQTTGGTVAVIVFAGGMIVILGGLWIGQVLHPSRLEITEQAVTMVSPKGSRTALYRTSGDEIRSYVAGSARTRRRCLTIDGSGTVIPVGFFSVAEIQRQCEANGWRFTKVGGRTAASSRAPHHGA